MKDYKNEDVLVLFSGGQDSTTCLYWAKKHFKNVLALCFTYGQRHSQEVDNARRIAEMADVSFKELDASIISELAPNSLTNLSITMDEEKPANALPNTFVPGRNMLFLTFAAAIAYAQGIKHLITGVSEADYSGYPDCRDTFIHSVNSSLNLAMDYSFLIHTPLMWLDKKNVWRLADELDVFNIVRNETLTCYNGIIADGCGNCPACKLRKKGLEEYLLARR
ncbi:MAG: 7-cyano-7-deazaguanine synthase QueC [Dysgonamonadaceae bacterium]|jgi:7-cyano-7-deazaguanine synthase|nr:7-cyano-7-deazaguanine synthase QueC [Dysgonamonadaceae bacterium]